MRALDLLLNSLALLAQAQPVALRAAGDSPSTYRTLMSRWSRSSPHSQLTSRPPRTTRTSRASSSRRTRS